MTLTDIANASAAIATLEAARASDLRTFLGTKSRNGGPWSGSGVTEARRMQQNLSSNPPGNLDSQAVQDGYRQLISRIGQIVAG